MPDAYENYMAFAHNMQKLHVTSAMAPRDITSDYDSRTINATSTVGPFVKEYPDTQQMERYDSLSPRGVLGIIDVPVNNNEIELTSDKAEIKILIQPVDKFQFRYETEKNLGSLMGEREKSSMKKEFPTVKLINCRYEDAIIRCTLATADECRRLPHAHLLVIKSDNVHKDVPYDIKVSEQNDFTATFYNMGIIHTAKKYIEEEIIKKLRIELLDEKRRRSYENTTLTIEEELKMKTEAKEAKKWMNLNSVCLCFQGFRCGENDILYPLTEKIYSRPINNLKSIKTCKLKICRINKHVSSCKGNEEVWLLVKKVDKTNIKVKFYEVDECENVLWEAERSFSECDVHYQYAIVVKTPPYKNTNITEPVEVFVRLERPSDGAISNSIEFLYKPLENNSSRKRSRIVSASTSLEVAPNAKPADQLLDNCMLETLTTLPGDEISSLSQELAKLLNDNEFNSQELQGFYTTSKSNSEEEMTLIEPPMMEMFSCDPLQQQTMTQGDKKVTNLHIELVGAVLDRTGGWEKLAQHTNNSSLVRLYRRTSCPSSAMLNKIQLQNPELTVSQLKRLLIEVQEHEAATVFDENLFM